MASLRSLLPEHLTTNRLTLEQFNYSTEHYNCLLASMNSPTAHRNMGDFGITNPEAFDKLNFGTRLSPCVFPIPVIVDTDVYYLMHLGNNDGPLMGGVSLAQRGSSVPPDVGWCVLEEYHGKGYASEAAKELLRMAREDLGIKEIMCWPGKGNLPSINVAKKIGLVEWGQFKDDNDQDALVFVLPGMHLDSNVVLKLYGD